MRCIEWCCRAGLAGLGLLAGCATPPGGPGEGSGPTTVARPAPAPAAPVPRQAPAAATPATTTRLPAPHAVRNWNELRLQAAQRIVAANPQGTYTGVVPDQLLAIPVLEIELNGDGSVRRIEVLRQPREVKDTVPLAVEAVRRAAPFGDVSRLPRPWKFVETFLFNDERKFKPRTLDH
ncbi:MAG TPA: hypothetical protein VF319_10415 [Caldimonas sp.]